MSRVFRRVLDLGFDADSQGEYGLVGALLQYADENHSGSDVLSNPFAETIRRFEAAGINPHALARLRQVLADGERRYATGELR